MMKYIKPVIVLSIITTIVSALLIITYNLTYVDNSGVITDALKEKCVSLMGEGEYSIITDWTEEGYRISKPDNVERLIKKADGTVAFEIVSNGYNKNGLTLLIAMNDDGSVKGISIISISETPGLGTKVNSPEFLDKFIGLSEKAEIVKKTPTSSNEVEAVTSATYSSKGVANAVNIAVETYKEMGAVK